MSIHYSFTRGWTPVEQGAGSGNRRPDQVLTGIGRLFTATGAGTVDDAVIALTDDRIAWAGPRQSFPGAAGAFEIDVGGALVTPGLVDAHSHPLYPAPRLAEVAARSAGAGYADIAAAGGGIAATVHATRAAPLDE